tara:strand:+ start:31 stop:270 length:240 start_codon:yes stop_codon:yes gene_type:complete
MKIKLSELKKIIKEYGREDYEDGLSDEWKSSVSILERLNDAMRQIEAAKENLKDAMDEENHELLRLAMIQLDGIKDKIK